ncbi:two-component system response regulator DctR [Paenibacillus sp. V4I3]|uniref:response regulator n=1 Tax=unclassified Paenibacillus TaxID=185978 RepID=UPI002783D9B9|nr:MULTISPECIES: response regulator [unclassified Paenibacillus]MDQ0871628.1 two-component system response regulator DctR [Paenibacillus sp. V4I3]MDQ0884954.1 two-component system response regulator DctR [Paenibacillus sp. V4I9]
MHRVVLIEDDPMVLEVNRQFVERVPGFEIVGTSSNGIEGIEKIRHLKPDLVILDIYMPGQNGTDVLQQIRNEQLNTDAIVITAANDIPTIQRMLHHGAVDYIMKPFKFERVQEALENYRMMKRRLGKESTLSQVELDQLLHGNNGGEPIPESPEFSVQMDLPKGLQALTMKQVMLFLMQQHKSLSAEEVAEGVGLARVTARRYLDFLEKNKQVKLDLEYGGIGRPINRYVWMKENKRS